MSARLATPISLNALTTRALLNLRSEPSDPDSSSSIAGDSLCGDGICQETGKTRRACTRLRDELRTNDEWALNAALQRQGGWAREAKGGSVATAQSHPKIRPFNELMLDFLAYLEFERGLSRNTLEAYRSDLMQFGALPGARRARRAGRGPAQHLAGS